MAVVDRIVEIGECVGLVDFGTRYASVSQWCSLPVDMFKIDQIFVRNISDEDQSMVCVQWVLSWSSAANMKVVAEGV